MRHTKEEKAAHMAALTKNLGSDDAERQYWSDMIWGVAGAMFVGGLFFYASGSAGVPVFFTVVGTAVAFILIMNIAYRRAVSRTSSSAAEPAPPPAPRPAPAPKPAPTPKAAPEPAPAPQPAPAPVAEIPVMSMPATLDAPRDGKADDLKLLKGVGPKLEEAINSLGVWHFDQIAEWGPEQVAWVDENLVSFKGRASRDEWVAQAKILAAGGETEFSQRQ